MGPRGARLPDRGDIYHLDADPVYGREERGKHYFLVVSPAVINRLGVSVCVAITTGGQGMRAAGTAVSITGGGSVTGVAVCNQIRAFDLPARERAGNARYIETIDRAIANEVARTAASVIDPA